MALSITRRFYHINGAILKWQRIDLREDYPAIYRSIGLQLGKIRLSNGTKSGQKTGIRYEWYALHTVDAIALIILILTRKKLSGNEIAKEGTFCVIA